MPARCPELQDFERAGRDDGRERCDETIAPVGKPEGEADENESERMLAILADIGGVWAIARGSESRKGDGGGEAPGNQAKKRCHATGITRIGQKYSADTKYPPHLVNATSFGTDLQRLPHAKPVREAGLSTCGDRK